MTRAPRQMLAAAAACAAAFCVLLALAYSGGPAQWVDGAALNGFVALGDRPTIVRAADAFAFLCNPAPYALLCLALLAYAYFKRGARNAAAAGLLLLGANATSQLLKPALAHPRSLASWPDVAQLRAQAFPSGHATASMALACAAVLVVPRRYRPITAAVGAVFALAVSISVLVLNWHWPSDVVGGQLVAGTWCFVALAAVRYASRRWPQRGSMRRAARDAVVAPRPRTLVAGALAALAAMAIVAASKRAEVVHFADAHTSALAAGVVIVASAVAVLAAVATLAVRR